MNNKQCRVILCGFTVILLMGLFPPWLETSATCLDHPPWRIMESGRLPVRPGNHVTLQRHGGYRFLFSARKEYTSGGGGASVSTEGTTSDEYSVTYYLPRRVDTSLLLVQWFLVSAVTGIIVMYLGDRRQSPADKPDE